MIASLRGTILEIRPFYLHLEVAGVGYAMATPLSLYEEYQGKTSEEVFVYTRQVFRDDGQFLYGFSTDAEAQLFEFLLKLSGIGPRVALNLISTLGTDELLKSLSIEDGSALTRAPRVGKAKAEKIIFESKGRKKKIEELLSGISAPEQTAESIDPDGDFFYQVDEALVSLGFQKKEIDNARSKIQKSEDKLPETNDTGLQAWIKLFLRYL